MRVFWFFMLRLRSDQFEFIAIFCLILWSVLVFSFLFSRCFEYLYCSFHVTVHGFDLF